MGRTEKATKNAIFGAVSYIIQGIISIYTQRLFIKHLGYDILGLYTVLNTIISTLGVLELGIGTAIVFSLYKPLAENDKP